MSFQKEGVDVKPMAAALTGALIAGVGMYAIGARAQDQFAMNAALPGNVPISYFASPQPVAQQPVAFAPVYAPAPAPQQVVYRPAAARQTVTRTTEPRIVSQTVDTRPTRSKTKTVLVIGGSAASGAGVGAMVGGKKGALIGAALGGGAASIYEATRR